MARAFTLILLAFATAACLISAPVKKAKTTSTANAKSNKKAAKTAAAATPAKAHASASANSRSASAPNVRTVKYVRNKHGKLVRVAAKGGPSYQLHPDSGRYQQLQQALADKGYFKGEVNGQWGDDSEDALRHFQMDQKLYDADGHITALTLIGLGLGPKHDHDLSTHPAPASTTPAAAQSSAPPSESAGH